MKRPLKLIPYSHQSINQKDIEAVTRVLKSDFITQGPEVLEFENAVANYVGAKYAVAFNSGASALVASCFASGIGSGDEVITTPYTFAASSNCFVWFGGIPKFVDIDFATLNINADRIEQAINKKTKAILAVDFAGNPCDWDRIKRIAKNYGLVTIDDAAHSIGSKYKGRMIGTIADITCFSFHPVKTITTGEGGMAVTNDKKLWEKLLIFRNHGITRKNLQNNVGGWYYEMQELGLNFRLTDFQAALGVSQLSRIERFIGARRLVVDVYRKAFSDLPIDVPKENNSSFAVWHLFTALLKLDEIKVSRKRIFDELKDRGLGVQVHYIPVHLQPYYRKKFGFKRGDFPISESVYESEISLPLFPDLSKKQIDYVIKTFKDVIGEYSR
ncbi:MAG: UDP-4-amino-4,6-dideoxy-N-acetyl-beta-L-altrosamine transaminase [Candidatus Curtissbacteria bacterium]|nr:UDP-4-amino-4,6-dideoxy-N-acetyl-beta-L-altrosamine transaminase [Candidatus Curtissbacteria bacterium]